MRFKRITALNNVILIDGSMIVKADLGRQLPEAKWFSKRAADQKATIS